MIRKEARSLAITREKKETLVNEYVEKLRRSQAVVVTEYRGLTHKQIEGLRRELRGAESELTISKNTLMARALTEVGLPAPEQLLSGPTAVAFCYNEVAAPAKVLTKFARDSKVLVLRGGLTGQAVFNEAGVQSLTELPGKNQLRAQVIGTLQSPIVGLVNVLAGSMRGLMNVLNARMAQLEQPEGAAPAAEAA
jgi:large subunit ribosomal protein L10